MYWGFIDWKRNDSESDMNETIISEYPFEGVYKFLFLHVLRYQVSIRDQIPASGATVVY